MKGLNFNTIKKNYFPVTLPDEKQTVLLIGSPTKAIMGELEIIQENLTKVTQAENEKETLNELYGACAKVMSRNKAGKKITKKDLESIFDVEDILIFFQAYLEFIVEMANQKN